MALPRKEQETISSSVATSALSFLQLVPHDQPFLIPNRLASLAESFAQLLETMMEVRRTCPCTIPGWIQLCVFGIIHHSGCDATVCSCPQERMTLIPATLDPSHCRNQRRDPFCNHARMRSQTSFLQWPRRSSAKPPAPSLARWLATPLLAEQRSSPPEMLGGCWQMPRAHCHKARGKLLLPAAASGTIA